MDVSCPAAGSDPDLFLHCSAIYGHGLAQALDLLPDEAQRAPGFAPLIIAPGGPIVKPGPDVQPIGVRHRATGNRQQTRSQGRQSADRPPPPGAMGN